MTRSKVRKYVRIHWDISFRKSYLRKSEDEQINELMSQCRWYIAAVAEQGRLLIAKIKIKRLEMNRHFYEGDKW